MVALTEKSMLTKVLAVEFDIPLVAERLSREQGSLVSESEVRNQCMDELRNDPNSAATIKAFMMMNLMQMMGDVRLHAAASMASGEFNPTETIRLLELVNNGLLSIADGPRPEAPQNTFNILDTGGSLVDRFVERLAKYNRPEINAPPDQHVVDAELLNDRVRFNNPDN